MSHDHVQDPAAAAAEARKENALAAKILIAIAAVVILAVILVALFGPQLIGIYGLIGTFIVYAVMLAFTAGN
ncbi:MAG: hypothetical protein Q4G24_04970 [Paracoccus sp. (in: a-proteobacteria)]|uniref:hypothetical protein n=1 Tax=Paracoccus sp. TaxID=267 RepID=UPI0026E00C14|nr:hypothetical protein [Paracoccus sp. (in: a-proteobacteria)]MDO5620805.1 hypothetical protein [Paracoccus sp. (in: a-proteobacteria)]